MSKLVLVGVLVGALLAGAGPATAQVVVPGGLGDPLTLAASGVVVPYIATGGVVTLIEVASPVRDNPNLHMEFFDSSCEFVGPSVGLPLTTNDIAFLNLPSQVPSIAGNSGLVAISSVDASGFIPAPLESPIHARAYVFDPTDGTSRVLEPVILDTAEWGQRTLSGFCREVDGVCVEDGQSITDLHTWSPLRTAVTFFAPQQTEVVHTTLFLICPQSLIQGDDNAYFNPDRGFPLFRVSVNGDVASGFPADPHTLRARVYDTNEVFLRNLTPIPCTCLTQIHLEDPTFVVGADIYAQQVGGTYTELEEIPGTDVSSAFTGYRAIFTVGSPLNNFFGRLSNGSRPSIQGNLFDTR